MIITRQGKKEILGKGESTDSGKSRKLAALNSYEKVIEFMRKEKSK